MSSPPGLGLPKEGRAPRGPLTIVINSHHGHLAAIIIYHHRAILPRDNKLSLENNENLSSISAFPGSKPHLSADPSCISFTLIIIYYHGILHHVEKCTPKRPGGYVFLIVEAVFVCSL
jgi:hypothetical protein